MSFLRHVFVFLTSANFNDIINIFVKSIFVLKIALTFIYDIMMSLEHFEIKNKDLFENRQLSTVPLNFNYCRVWQ